MNRIQFQTGLLRLKFLKQSGTEAQCEAVLKQARWFQCFVCSCRANTGHSVFKVGSHKTLQSIRLLLTVLFLAIYLIGQAKTGLAVLALKQYLSVSYPIAWLIEYKLKDNKSEYETTLLSWPPLFFSHTQTADFSQLKTFDNQK
ncbi:MAG: hypothetical protein WAW61_10490 [Methylococcaceae bacterium]